MIALSGVRSSWEIIPTNSSFMRATSTALVSSVSTNR